MSLLLRSRGLALRLSAAVNGSPLRAFSTTLSNQRVNNIYIDHIDVPVPACRWVADKNMTSEMKELRAKEKGDWKDLSIEEKRKLYRLNFRINFKEWDVYYRGIWRETYRLCLIWAVYPVLIALSIAIYAKHSSYIEEEDKQRVKYMEAPQKAGRLPMYYDYEKNEWRDTPFMTKDSQLLPEIIERTKKGDD